MVKASTTRVTWLVTGETDYWSASFSLTARDTTSFTEDTVKISNSNSSALSVNFKAKFLNNNWSDWLKLNPYYQIWDWSDVWLSSSTSSGSEPLNDVSVSIPSWQTLRFKYKNNMSYSTNVRTTNITRTMLVVSLSWRIDIYKNKDILLLPRTIKEIWQLMWATSFWRHIDWSWITWN